MDIGLCKFFSFSSSESLVGDTCTDLERQNSTVGFDWNSEHENEINGDFSVIPLSGSLSSIYSVSPPTKENWQTWQHLLGSDSGEIYNNELLLNNSPLCSPVKLFKSPIENVNRVRRRILSESSENGMCELAQSIFEDIKEQIDIKNIKVVEQDCVPNVSVARRKISLSDNQENFDLAEYVFQKPDDKPKTHAKAAVKKIDLQAQKYIVEEENSGKKSIEEEGDVDIETVSDNENNPVLEAGDLASLLEQFEATEKKVSNDSTKGKVFVKVEPIEDVTDSSSLQWEKSIASNIKTEVTICHDDVNPVNDIKTADSCTKLASSVNKNELTPTKILPKHYVHNPNARKVLDYLPQEVVDRIKESGKRKPITVIEPIVCSKKLKSIKTEIKQEQTEVNSKSTSLTYLVQLDHNYCSNSCSPVFKKDSGFASSEEEERILFARQPTIKNSDGKVMVSILKNNTVHQIQSNHCKKKKLNLEEYKKLRKCDFKSENCSPSESTCSSPLPEDEHERMLRHQEKLRRMAEGVLHAAPKSEKSTSSTVKAPSVVPPPIIIIEKKKVFQDDVVLPPNLERKVLVSFGVNTDFKIPKGEDPLAPVKKLKEIEPLLEKASDKINENSLITSLIENIPKIIKEKEKVSKKENSAQHYEHGEDKEVLHLEKNRVRCETRDAAVQTDISLVNQCKRGRTRCRVSSSSSDGSTASDISATSSRNRNTSESSTISTSSSSSSSSSCQSRAYSPWRPHDHARVGYSRSRSRSLSPRISRKRLASDHEHRSAVEERRIIYVGRITRGTAKDDLRKKFQKFGPITNVSLHFRDQGYRKLENYGFVTFKYKQDAHEAYEQGNNDPNYANYKISFGGRREFCQNPYTDLDNVQDDEYYSSKNGGDSFDNLLREMQEKLKRRRI